MASQFTDAECAILRTMINEHHAAVSASSTAPSNCSPAVATSLPPATISFADILKKDKCALSVLNDSLAVIKNDGTAAWRIAVVPSAMNSTWCTVLLLSLDSKTEDVCSAYPQCYFADGDLTHLVYIASAVHALSKTFAIPYTLDTVAQRYGRVLTPTAYEYIRRYIK